MYMYVVIGIWRLEREWHLIKVALSSGLKWIFRTFARQLLLTLLKRNISETGNSF